MDAHVAQARRHGDRLVRHDPDLPEQRSISIGKPIAGSSPGRPLLQQPPRFGGRPRWRGPPVWWNSRLATERAGLRIGSRFIRQTKLMSVSGRGKDAEDVGPLVVEVRAVDLDEADVVGPGVEAQPPQPGGVERRGRGAFPAGGDAFLKSFDGGVLSEDDHFPVPFRNRC